MGHMPASLWRFLKMFHPIRSMEDCVVDGIQQENLAFLGFTRDAFRDLLLSIPTRAYLNIHTERLENTLARELEGVCTEIQINLQVKHNVQIVRDDLAALQQVQGKIDHCNICQQLLIDNLEDTNRKSNIKIRGIPSSIPKQDLAALALQIFNEIRGKPLDTHLELDGVYRLGKPLGNTQQRNDVLCRFCYLKDIVNRQVRLGKVR